jgi:hypothetical protein
VVEPVDPRGTDIKTQLNFVVNAPKGDITLGSKLCEGAIPRLDGEERKELIAAPIKLVPLTLYCPKEGRKLQQLISQFQMTVRMAYILITCVISV